MRASMTEVRSWHHGAVHVIAIRGELDREQVARVVGDVMARLAGLGGDEAVAFDLDGVRHCSAAGARCIVGLLAQAERDDIAAQISRASRPVRDAFELLGLERLLPMPTQR